MTDQKASETLNELLIWLEKKEKQLGRPLRIAHIGNVANNAYLMSRKQRGYGIDAVCLSPDYLHVMGFPEWEELSYFHTSENHFEPLSHEVTKCRPDWFYSGSWSEVTSNFMDRFSSAETSMSKQRKTLNFRRYISRWAFAVWKIIRPIGKAVTPKRWRSFVVNFLLHTYRVATGDQAHAITTISSQVDFVHFYGSYNFVTELGKVNTGFVSTEHGTIREFVFDNSPASKLSRKGYENSAAILVTNQDSYNQAEILSKYGAKIISSPHPIRDDNFEKFRTERLANLNEGNTLRILVPARQALPTKNDVGKGHEKFFESMSLLDSRNIKFEVELVSWGDHQFETRKYLKEHGLLDHVSWIPVMTRTKLRERMLHSDVVVDQFNVAAYGAIAADALGLGVPIITKHSCSNDNMQFGSCAPVLAAENSDEIFAHYLSLINMDKSQKISKFEISTNWYDSNMHSDYSLIASLKAYKLIDNKIESNNLDFKK